MARNKEILPVSRADCSFFSDRIAHNWIVDLFRSHKQAFELNDVLPCDELPEEEAARQIRHKQVRRTIRRLTPEQQKVITLKYLECWRNEEIARVLGKPVGAVKSIQHRALVSLHMLRAAS